MTILIVGNGSPEHSIVYRLRTLEDAALPKPGMKDLFYRAAGNVLGTLIVAFILFWVAVSQHLVVATP